MCGGSPLFAKSSPLSVVKQHYACPDLLAMNADGTNLTPSEADYQLLCCNFILLLSFDCNWQRSIFLFKKIATLVTMNKVGYLLRHQYKSLPFEEKL